jgi:hypothetical protein
MPCRYTSGGALAAAGTKATPQGAANRRGSARSGASLADAVDAAVGAVGVEGEDVIAGASGTPTFSGVVSNRGRQPTRTRSPRRVAITVVGSAAFDMADMEAS